MYTSWTFIVTALVAFLRVAVATPPACLISAMGAQPNPADLKSLCGTLEPQVVGNITEKCSGDAESSAISAYSATCLSSESVTISITSSASSSSKTGSATTTGTGTAKATGTATGSKTTGTGTATATGTSSGSTSSATGNAGSSTTPQFAMAVLAAGFAGQYLL